MVGQSLGDALIDVAELRVPIGVVAALPGFTVRLQTEFLLPQ